MNSAYILIIEDDEIVAKTVERCLRGNGYRVQVVNSGVAGLRAAHRKIPDLVILDVIMPGMDGYTVCKEMKDDAQLKDVPVLFLTAKVKDDDKIIGLSVGADDYLGKPFNINELLLRVRAILRRTNQAGKADKHSDTVPVTAVSAKDGAERDLDDKSVIRIGDFSLNTLTYVFNSPYKGKFRLTPVQYSLLYHMMTHPNKIFSASVLLEEVWDYPADTGSTDLVRVHIKNLRENIEADPKRPVFIKTIQGYGYSIPSVIEQ